MNFFWSKKYSFPSILLPHPLLPTSSIPSKFGELDKYSGLCKEILVSDKNCWLGWHIFAQCPCPFSDPSLSLSYCFTFHLFSLTKHWKQLLAPCLVGSQPAFLRCPIPVPQNPSQVYWTGSLVPVRHHLLYQSPLLATQGGSGIKKWTNPSCIFSLCHLCKPQTAQARSAHRDTLIEMLFGSRLCPCTNVHKMTN